MIDVLGRASGGKGERVVSLERDGERLTIWIHAPGADRSTGCDIQLSMSNFLNALGSVVAGGAPLDPGIDAPVEPNEEF